MLVELFARAPRSAPAIHGRCTFHITQSIKRFISGERDVPGLAPRNELVTTPLSSGATRLHTTYLLTAQGGIPSSGHSQVQMATPYSQQRLTLGGDNVRASHGLVVQLGDV